MTLITRRANRRTSKKRESTHVEAAGRAKDASSRGVPSVGSCSGTERDPGGVAETETERLEMVWYEYEAGDAERVQGRVEI